VITSTVAFWGFATEFVSGGAALLTLDRWHGGIMLAVVVGGFAVDVLFNLFDFTKERR